MIPALMEEFRDRRILVTGGTGSIGSVIVKELLKCRPYQIRVYSRDDTKQYQMAHELNFNPSVLFLIGDVRDKERLYLAMENIDIVFHAAALKHVGASENNPFEAVKTNVEGTQNVIDCAFARGVDKVVGISTDKAAGPTNVMGTTKLLAEKLMLATYFYKGHKKTKFSCVRFGNVVGSRGSVIPLFIDQIKRGGPVTVTDPEMTRFFMTTKDAVELVLNAVQLMKDREIFILKMPALRMKDLAEATIEVFRKKNKKIQKNIKIKIIGRRPGDRIHEKLMTRDESEIALESQEMFIIPPNLEYSFPPSNFPFYPNTLKKEVGEYTSETQDKMSRDEIVRMLEKADELEF